MIQFLGLAAAGIGAYVLYKRASREMKRVGRAMNEVSAQRRGEGTPESVRLEKDPDTGRYKPAKPKLDQD